MGQILNANCRICNFETDFKYGGGQFNYHENRPVSAINKETGQFETVNYYFTSLIALLSIQPSVPSVSCTFFHFSMTSFT